MVELKDPANWPPLPRTPVIIWMRKASFWTALIGFSFFVFGDTCAALGLRFVTEALRLPYFHQERIKDQVYLCLFVMAGCLYGLYRFNQ